MATPVFEEFDPESDCACQGCVHWRRVNPHAPGARLGGHPAARRALVAAAAAVSAVIGGYQPAAALTAHHAPQRPGPSVDTPDTPQGARSPLHGHGNPAKDANGDDAPKTTRTEIINRAKTWVAAKVPYSMDRYWTDGYRQDCSGYVSMAWGLPNNEWTGSLGSFGVKIGKEDLQPGDILLFHNPDNPEKGSHVVIFGGWTDHTHTSYTAYEQTPPNARKQSTPYAYWNNSSKYVPYRYKSLTETTSGTSGSEENGGTKAGEFPGAKYFGPGADNAYVTQLGRMLIARGAGAYYKTGAGPRWSDADLKATQAFQKAQGWSGADADGLPGPFTWDLLVTGAGKDIPATPSKTGTPGAPASHGVPGYPGRNLFQPGANNTYVTQLGKQLVKKGFGAFYTTGPGPSWSEADRRAVEAFQRAQGWRGGAADGYPGPETWRRLFS
ncbi:peptidoglycan-binding protein [Streptomyces sp. NPDC086787]|uniref:peptidoglycan-binding protein n=1 Tax=Streptomyces sp. NPDC086787 TaxID=3365759 RepID=UPI0038094973